MNSTVAVIVTILGIFGLWSLDKEETARTSWAVWLPIIWLLISGSRHVSTWFGVAPVMSEEQYLEGSPLDAWIYAFLLAAAIAVLFGRSGKVERLVRKNWPIILFVLYCALSVTWSDFPGVALKRFIKSLGDYAMVLIVLTEDNHEFALRRVLTRVSLILLPLSILFIKYFPSLGRTYASHWAGTQYFVGVCDTKNMLGMVCLVFGFAAFSRLLVIWNGPRRFRTESLILYGALAGMAVWLLILSDSKTSLACFMLTSGLVTVQAFSRTARKPVIISALVVSVILSCFTVLFLGVGGSALEAMGRNSSLTGRTAIWAILLTVPVNPMVGTGFESFWLGHRLSNLWSYQILSGITEAHNGYLEVYLNLGFVGDGLLAVLLWTGFINIMRLLKQDTEAGRIRLGFLVIAIVYNLTEAGIRSTDLIWIALLVSITALPEYSVEYVSVPKARSATFGIREPQPAAWKMDGSSTPSATAR